MATVFAWAQDPPPASVQAEVDRTEITIGDKIQYTLTIERAPGVEARNPGWGEGLEGFQILDFDRGEPKKVGERWRTVDTYILSTYTPEEYVIPPLQVPIVLPSGATQVLETQPIAIKVASVLPDDEEALELRDLKNPIPVFSGVFTGRVITALVAALAIVAFLYALWRRRHREALPELAVPPRPEHEVAFERLDRLEGLVRQWGKTPEQSLCKEFGLELSETIREYLERRFGFIALEMTTDEIRGVLPTILKTTTLHLAAEGHKPLSEPLLEVLDETDLMKFAKSVYSSERLLSEIETCRRAVEATRRRDEDRAEPGETVNETGSQREAA